MTCFFIRHVSAPNSLRALSLCVILLTLSCGENKKFSATDLGNKIADGASFKVTDQGGLKIDGLASCSLNFDDSGPPILINDKFIFAEGPVWDKRLGVLFFSDIDDNSIYKLTLPNAFTIFRKPSNNANGLTFDKDGLLLAAQHGSRSVTRTLADGTVQTIAETYDGKKLNSPNDIVVRADGNIYFTDPTFGLKNQPSELGFMGLYRLDLNGTLFLEAKIEGSPNGLGFSPDEKTLYVTVTFKDQILSFDVGADGAVSNPKTFATVIQPDGMTVDDCGNLFVASNDSTNPSVVVISSAGQKLGAISLSYAPTNCKFGGTDGKSLFITARQAIYRLSMP